MADPIRQNNEKFGGVQRLIFSKKFAGELWSNELGATAGCPVRDQDRVTGLTLSVLFRLSQSPVVDPFEIQGLMN